MINSANWIKHLLINKWRCIRILIKFWKSFKKKPMKKEEDKNNQTKLTN